MGEYKIYSCQDKSKYCEIVPNFIYNRFDLWDKSILDGEVELYCYESEETRFYFEVLAGKTSAKLGVYLMNLSADVLKNIADFVFATFKVSTVTYENGYSKLGDYIEHNHLRIELPETAEELDARLSTKGKYNIKREKRLTDEKFGGYKIINLSALDEKAEKIWEHYFKFKNNTHSISYGLSVKEYCNKYHVTDIYVLLLGEEERIGSIILSCEQCPIVYIENLTYDTEISSYSPGKILYDEYLKMLIAKGVKEIYLLGGNYSYKKRYSSIEETVYNATIYKNALIRCRYKLKKFIIRCLRYIKRLVKH